MGDRFDRLSARHPNVEALLRRPGIGHNNGPTFDMSWEAWVWRRASAKAWKTPSPEIAKMRIRRAERLGLTYKELTAALMNTGVNLGAAVMPLSLAARVRRGPKGEIVVEPRNSTAALVAKFGGRLFLLGGFRREWIGIGISFVCGDQYRVVLSIQAALQCRMACTDCRSCLNRGVMKSRASLYDDE